MRSSTKISIVRMEIDSFIFIVVIGSLAHFVFNFFDCHSALAAFTPVNESVWEHLKLIFFPLMTFAVFEWSVIGRERHNFWAAKALSVIASMGFISGVFYLYTGIFGTNFLAADIALFVIAAALSSLISIGVMLKTKIRHGATASSVIIILLIGAAFAVFSFDPPRSQVFRDPSGIYGARCLK